MHSLRRINAIRFAYALYAVRGLFDLECDLTPKSKTDENQQI